MVRMMALYEYKEFLNFHDVARYLHDREIEYFNPYDDNDINRLRNFILDLYNEDKLHPVFYYDGLARYGFELDTSLILLRGWINVSKKMITDLFNDSKIDLNVNDYLKVYKLHSDTENTNIGDIIEDDLNNYIYMDTSRYKLDPPKIDGDGNLIPPKKRMDIVFEVLKEYGEDIKHNPALKLEDYHDRLPKIIKNDIWLNFDELLYPKIDLDKLFDTKAQIDNSELIEQISKLKSKLTIANDTIASQMAELAIVKAKLDNLEQKGGLYQSDTALDDDILNYDEVKAIQAIKNGFWLDYDPKNKPVLKLVVTEWITQNYPSINPSMASWLDKIVRQKYVK